MKYPKIYATLVFIAFDLSTKTTAKTQNSPGHHVNPIKGLADPLCLPSPPFLLVSLPLIKSCTSFRCSLIISLRFFTGD